ncbi:MAG: peptidylprolyl isomerase [Bacteroidota bacterium]
MRGIVAWVFLFVCGAVQAQIKQSGPYLPPQYVDGIVAVVGSKIILQSDFETEKMQLTKGAALKDSQTSHCKLLEDMIIQKLLLNQAELDSLVVPDDQLESEIDNRLRYYQRNAGSMAELEKYLGKTVNEFKDDIRPKMKEQLLAKQMYGEITKNIRISPQEVKLFYDSIPMDSLPIVPTEVEVGQLMIEPMITQEAKDFAKMQLEDIRARVMRGESFEKLARAYSMDPGSKSQGGMLPEFGRGEMVPAFERMAFRLKPDSVSPIFESDYGFHIMKLLKRRGERVIAMHILIRAENTTEDFKIASMRVDSVYQLLQSGKLSWCEAVKKYATEDKYNRDAKGNCGFIMDPMTGMQKTTFEYLPSEVKKTVDKLKPGEFSEPEMVTTQDGRSVYRIVYLQSFVAPHQANLIQDYSRIQMEAESRKKQKAVDSWVYKHRTKTYIRIKARNLDCDNLTVWEHE